MKFLKKKNFKKNFKKYFLLKKKKKKKKKTKRWHLHWRDKGGNDGHSEQRTIECLTPRRGAFTKISFL